MYTDTDDTCRTLTRTALAAMAGVEPWQAKNPIGTEAEWEAAALQRLAETGWSLKHRIPGGDFPVYVIVKPKEKK